MAATGPAVSDGNRVFGFWTAVSLVLGNMIGSGIFLLPASLAAFGGLSLAGWLVSATGSLCLALVFARLARAHPDAGGPYAYTRRAFGDFAGFLVAWGYWISIWCSNAALAVAFVSALDPFLPGIVRSPPAAAALAIGTLWLLTGVNLYGARSAGRVQLVTTALKILPLVFVGLAGLAFFAPADFAIPPAEARGGGLMQVVTLTLWAFLGLECATVPARAVQNADRTIPRATIAGTLAAALIYIVSTVGVMSVLGPETLATSNAPFADAASTIAGRWAGAAVGIGVAISCFGALNGWILMVGQLPMAVAQDGLFPPLFARVTGRGVPGTGLILAAVLSSTLIAMNYSQNLVALFTQIILLATLSTLVPYVFCALAGFLSRSAPNAGRAIGKTDGAIAAAAFVYAVIAVAGAGSEVVYLGFLLLIAGLPVYVWVARRTAPASDAA